MKLSPTKLAISGAATATILWIICSVMVLLMPGAMLNMTGYMLHGDFSGMEWHIDSVNLLLGLIAWVVTGAATGWLVAVFYNRLGNR